MKKTDILDLISRKLSPFILLFGFYLLAYGHISPGGGFQGGVVIASGIILLLLCQDTAKIRILFPPRRFALFEIGAFFAFLLVGLMGIILEGSFLGIFIRPYRAEALSAPLSAAGFIFLLNLVIGLKVGAGISLICYYLFEEHKDLES